LNYSDLSKVAYFNLPRLHYFGALAGGDHICISQRHLASEK